MESVSIKNSELMSIGELSRLCGVHTVTLRAWERRYGLLQPERNPKGHRFYRAQHVDEVMEILKWLERGYAISKVKSFLNREASTWAADDVWLACRQQCSLAIRDVNQARFDHVISDMLATYPLGLCADNVLLPCLDQWVVDFHGRLMPESVFYFGLNALRTRFHHRLLQVNRSQRNKPGRPLMFVTLSEARYDGHFYVIANMLMDAHQQVNTYHASGCVELLPQIVPTLREARVLFFANSALSSSQINALRDVTTQLKMPAAMMGAALDGQRDRLSGLPLALLPGTGSAAITNWRAFVGGEQ